MKGEPGYLKKRSRSQYISSLVSIALVLFILALFATASLFGKTFARYARATIVMKVFLHDGIPPAQQEAFIATLASEPFVRNTAFVSKDDAGRFLLERTGEDIRELMDGLNPLLASVDVYLQEGYINLDSLAAIQSRLEAHKIVAEVAYPAEMVEAVSRNARTFALIALFVGLLVVAISFYLIFGTIRLSIYAKRLTIRSMQLLGATRSFIRRPFLLTGISQGLFAGLLAVVLLLILLAGLQFRFPEIDLTEILFPSWEFIGILCGIVLFGTVLGLSGSFLAVNTYLDKNLDEII
jgi:cell division transport system permease protein